LLGIALAAAGCAPTGAAGTGPGELAVFGAASLRDVLGRIETAYEAAGPGVQVTIATDSSAALRTQIEQGAPADVFLSADLDQPRRLVAAGLAEAVLPFAANDLAIVAALADGPGVRAPVDLAQPGIRIIAAGPEVPITRYATALLERLAALDGYPAGFVRAYELNVESREDNVGAIIARIELGEGDAAIVYATDADASDRIRHVPVPPEASVRAVYGAVALRGASPAAAAFLDWLVGPAGRSILAADGFLPP
jgi:molybdate transport system substrate-binding protein